MTKKQQKAKMSEILELMNKLRETMTDQERQEFNDDLDAIVAERRSSLKNAEELEKLKAEVNGLRAGNAEMRRCLKSAYIKLKGRDDPRNRTDYSDLLQDIMSTLGFVMQEDSEEEMDAWIEEMRRGVIEETAWNPFEESTDTIKPLVGPEPEK